MRKNYLFLLLLTLVIGFNSCKKSNQEEKRESQIKPIMKDGVAMLEIKDEDGTKTLSSMIVGKYKLSPQVKKEGLGIYITPISAIKTESSEEQWVLRADNYIGHGMSDYCGGISDDLEISDDPSAEYGLTIYMRLPGSNHLHVFSSMYYCFIIESGSKDSEYLNCWAENDPTTDTLYKQQCK